MKTTLVPLKVKIVVLKVKAEDSRESKLMSARVTEEKLAMACEIV